MLWTIEVDWGRCILCQKDSIVPLFNPSGNRNNEVCGYVTLKNNIEDFQRTEVPFPVGIPVHLNELQDGDEIIQNLKDGKVKSHKKLRIRTFSFKVSQIIIHFESCLT